MEISDGHRHRIGWLREIWTTTPRLSLSAVPLFKSNWIEVWTVSMSGNLPQGVAGLLRWPRNRLVHPFSGKKQKNKRPEMERETLRIRERKPKNTAASQQFYCLFFFSWVEGVVYVDAPVPLAHLSNLELVRVSVKSYRCIEWNQTSFPMQTAGKRLCRLVWSTSSSSALLQPPFIIPAIYIVCVYTKTNLRLILLIIQIFIVTSKK